jgi:hypothetical protein
MTCRRRCCGAAFSGSLAPAGPLEAPALRAATGTKAPQALYGAYLGPVTLSASALEHDERTVVLEAEVQGVRCKVLDAQRYGIQAKEYVYDKDALFALDAALVDREVSRVAYGLALRLRLELYPEQYDRLRPFLLDYKDTLSYGTVLSFVDPSRWSDAFAFLRGRPPARERLLELYRDCLLVNVGVDALFNMIQFVDFMESLGGLHFLPKTLLSVVNVPDFDNAYMANEYFVAGNGSGLFMPLVTCDIMGHEIAHLVIQRSSNLVYRGHSGALNEGFADVLGTGLEHFIVDRFNNDAVAANDVLAASDFLIGEDAARAIPFLRSMSAPKTAAFPQPSVYRGLYWVDPTSPEDHGGVHTNSSILNRCFYEVFRRRGIHSALRLFFRVMFRLPSTAHYLDVRDALLRESRDDFFVVEALHRVGLDGDAALDF